MNRDGDPAEDLPDQLFFRIGELAELVGVETHVLRYWESEFGLQPERSTSGQRVYRRRDIQRFLEIRRLLHNEGFTIAGARKALQEGAGESVPSDLDVDHVQRVRARIRSARDKISVLRAQIAQNAIRDD